MGAAGRVAGRVNRGEIWLYTFKPPDKRRPVVVLSRQKVIGLLSTVIVAPITTSIRGVPSEVLVGIEEGLKAYSVVNLDHVQTVERSDLKHYIGCLGPEKMAAVCEALAIAAGCESDAA